MIPIREVIGNQKLTFGAKDSTNITVLSPNESALQNALLSPRLANATTQAILAIMAKGMVILGIKGDRSPSPELMQLMIDECKNFHGGLTVAELNLAFEMAARGSLDFDVNTYQNFSMLYFNQMLSAYKKWASQAIRAMPDMENAKPEFSHYIYERKSINQHRADIQSGYTHFLEGILPSRNYIPYEWYQILCDDGFIEYDENADVKRNARYNDLTSREKAALVIGQEYVWELFTMAKELKRNIYEQERNGTV
jgi:hypothetical protein